MPKEPKKRIVLAPQLETNRREDDIRSLIRIVEPDPEYQEPLVTDEASLLDAVGASPEEVQARLEAHFGARLAIPLTLPLWRFVDALAALRPGWQGESDAPSA
jgi:hypothetical protein